MRTFINRITKITGFGIGQDRVVVTVRDERRNGAAQHLAHWHASWLSVGLMSVLAALKQAAAALVEPAYRPVPVMCMSHTGGSMRPGLPRIAGA